MTAISEEIFWIGVNDRKTVLFEELWPLPHGISYNAYLIRDEKTVLIDAVKKEFSGEFESKLRALLSGTHKLDYFVINHMEPDHSGALGTLFRLYPGLCVVGNEKTLRFVNGFYHLPVKTLEVRDGETLSLGRKTLKFFMTPMLHWPETMMTYEQTSRTLFSGDAFGSFGALPGEIFDDKVDPGFFEGEARRYFSNILAKYCVPLRRALNRIKELDIKIIAPAHGPVHGWSPKRILDFYSSWSRYETERGVVIVYASMYGHTQKMAETVASSLEKSGVKKVSLLNVSHTHLSFILSEIWRYEGLVLGSCTYNTKIFPLMESLLSMLANFRLEGRMLGIFGSQSWGGGALTALRDFVQKSGCPLIEPVAEAMCAPSDEVLTQCSMLGKNMAQALSGSRQ